MTNLQKKRRRGPAPKPEAEQRRNRVGAYFSDAELSRLIAVAFPDGTDCLTDKAVSRGLGRYIRNLVLGTTPPSIPAINRQAWAELARANANLNQAQALANVAGSNELVRHAAEVNQAVKALRARLIGLPIFEGSDDES